MTMKLSQLSSGERQRVQLAIALLCDYQIILCDEITNALDEENKIQVVELLKMLAKTYKKMIIVVSHDDMFMSISDVVYTIQDEKIYQIKASTSQIGDRETKLDLKKKVQLDLFCKTYLNIKLKRYMSQYLGYFCLLGIVMVLTLLGFQIGTQYTSQLNALQDSVIKDQYYVMNVGADASLVGTSFADFNPPIENEMIQILNDKEHIQKAEPLLFFKMRIPTIEVENVSFHIIKEANEKTLELDTRRLNDNIFSYYDLKSMESKCEQFISGEDGIILTKSIADLLGIQTLEKGMYLRWIVNIPTTMKPILGSTSTKTGERVTTENAEVTYTKKEIEVPIIGILSYEHTSLSECFGYLHYDFMDTLIKEVQSTIILEEEQALWEPNTYTVFLKREDFDSVYDDVYAMNSQYALHAIQDSTANNMARWIAMEKDVRMYTTILFACSLVLMSLYSVFIYRKDKHNLTLLSKQLLNKKEMINLFKKECIFLGSVLLIIHLILVNIEMFIGFKIGTFIPGVRMWQQVLTNNVLTVIYTFVLLMLSHVVSMRHIKTNTYD